MTAQHLSGKSWGVPLLVSAGIVYEIIAANCSSPQTTEINADTRADTLMKWVYLGLAQSALFVIIAAICDPENAAPMLLGGFLAAIVMWALYVHGKQSGLRSQEKGTEY